MVERIRVNLPVGRIVQGDLYTANDKDFDTGLPRVYPQGHRLAGQPKITYFFAVAIKKGNEQHWSQTPWGKLIWEFGYAAWPKLIDQNPQSPRRGYLPDDFAWKIEDGDSHKPHKPQKGKPGRVNSQTEGMPGSWIVGCSSSFPPKIIDSSFGPLTEPNAVRRGFWVEAVVTVDSNETDRNPGIYVNGEFVMFRAIDKEIGGQSVDPRSIAGFGQSALPAGVTAVGASAPGGTPAPGGAPTAPYTGAAPSFPTPGMPPHGPGFGGMPGAAPPPAFAPSTSAPPPGANGAPITQAPGSAASPSSPPMGAPYIPPGITAVPGFLPVGPLGAPNAPAPGYPPSGAAPVAHGAPPYGPTGAPGNGWGNPPINPGNPPAAPGVPVLTAKCPPGLTWEMMATQGWTVENARAQGYVL